MTCKLIGSAVLAGFLAVGAIRLQRLELRENLDLRRHRSRLERGAAGVRDTSGSHDARRTDSEIHKNMVANAQEEAALERLQTRLLGKNRAARRRRRHRALRDDLRDWQEIFPIRRKELLARRRKG